jgi:hypothetical protein
MELIDMKKSTRWFVKWVAIPSLEKSYNDFPTLEQAENFKNWLYKENKGMQVTITK